MSYEKIISYSKRVLVAILMLILILIVIVFVSWYKTNSIEFELVNETKKDFYVYIWDTQNPKKIRNGFTSADYTLPPSPTSPNGSLIGKKTREIKFGEWIEFQTTKDTEFPKGMGIYFKKHHLISQRYEAIADSTYLIYRMRIDKKIKLDYSGFWETLKYIIRIISGDPVIFDPFNHITGHPCEPKPSDPPGSC